MKPFIGDHGKAAASRLPCGPGGRLLVGKICLVIVLAALAGCKPANTGAESAPRAAAPVAVPIGEVPTLAPGDFIDGQSGGVSAPGRPAAPTETADETLARLAVRNGETPPTVAFNEDGTVRVGVFTEELMYRDRGGVWQDIDLNVIQRPADAPAVGPANAHYEYENETNRLKSYFPDVVDPEAPVVVNTPDNAWIALSMEEFRAPAGDGSLTRAAPQSVHGAVSNNVVTYRDILRGIDDEYVVMTEGLKHNVVLKSRPDGLDQLAAEGSVDLVYRMALAEGLSLWADGKRETGAFSTTGAIEVRKADGKTAFFLTPPVIYERVKEGERIEGAYQVTTEGGQRFITIQTPIAWLADENRQWPVVIDPTVAEVYTAYAAASSNWDWVPYNTYYHDGRMQSIYTAAELNASGFGGGGAIKTVKFYCSETPQQAVTNFRIRFKHTAAASFGSAAWDTSGWTLCYGPTNIGQPGVGWQTYNLSTPFTWNGSSNLMMELSRDNSSYTDLGAMHVRGQITNASVGGMSDSGYAWPFDSMPVYTQWNYLPRMELTLDRIPSISGGLAGTTWEINEGQSNVNVVSLVNYDSDPDTTGPSLSWTISGLNAAIATGSVGTYAAGYPLYLTAVAAGSDPFTLYLSDTNNINAASVGVTVVVNDLPIATAITVSAASVPNCGAPSGNFSVYVTSANLSDTNDAASAMTGTLLEVYPPAGPWVGLGAGTWNAGSSRWQWDLTATGSWATGSYSYRVQFKDDNPYGTWGSVYTQNGVMTVTTCNTAPNAPALVSPADGGWVTITNPTLDWNFSDPDGGDTQSGYTCQVDDSSGFGSINYDSGDVSSGTTAHTFAALGQGTWYWRARTRDTIGSAWGPYNGTGWVVRVDSVAPGVPGTPTDAGAYSASTTVTFNWTAAFDATSGVASYWLQVGTTPGGSNVFNANVGNVLTYNVTGADTQTLYARLYAIDTAGLSGSWSGNSDGITIDATAPGAPGTPTDEGVYKTSTTCNFSWTAASDPGSGIISYWLAVGTTPGAIDVYNADVGNVLTANVTGANGQTLYAKVRARNGAGTYGGYSGNSNGILIDTTAPGAPGTPTDAGVYTAGTTVTFNWTAAADGESGVASYWLAVGTTPGGTNVFNANVGNVLTYNVVGADTQTLYAKVYAVNNAGTAGAWSGNSNGITIDTSAPGVPGTPTDAGAYTASTTVTFNWTAAADATSGVASYVLQVGTTPGASDVYNANVGNVLTKDVTGADGQTLYARVQAIDTVGWSGSFSGNSNGITIDTSAPGAPGTPTDEGVYKTSTTCNFSWTAASDPGSGIISYWLAVGTTPGATDVYNADVGNVLTANATGANGQTLYAKVRARNGALTYGGYSGNSDGILIDTTAPGAPGTPTDAGVYTPGTTVTFNWTSAADGESGIASYWLAVGTTPGAIDVYNANVGNVLTKDVTGADTQTLYAKVYAVNNAGTSGAWSGNSNGITIDATAPTAPGTPTDAGAYSTSATVTFNWTAASDPGSGVASYWLAVGTTPGATDVYNANVGAVLTKDITGVNGQTLYAKAAAINGAGTQGSFSGNSDGITIDLTDPAAPIALSATPAGWTNTNSFTLNWTNPADTSGIVSKYYKVGAAPTTDVDGTLVGGGAASIAGVAADAQGSRTAYVWLVDGSGRIDYLSNATATLNYDGTGDAIPSLLAKTDAAGSAIAASTWQTDDDPYFYWTAPTSDSPITGYSYALDASPDNVSEGTNLFYQVAVDALSNGVHTFYVKAQDAAGNWGAENTFVIWVDDATPDIAAVAAWEEAAHTTSIAAAAWQADGTVSFTWTDPASASNDTFYYEYNTSSGTTIDGTESSVTAAEVNDFVLTEGNYYFHVRPRNGAGTWGTERTFNIWYDNSPPTTPGVPSPAATPTNDTTPTWTWTASTDAGIGPRTVNTYEVFWSTTAGGEDNSAYSNTNSFTHVVALADGTWYFKVRAYDQLDKVSGFSGNGSVVIDATPPSAATNIQFLPIGGNVRALYLNLTNTNFTAWATVIAGQATGGEAELLKDGVPFAAPIKDTSIGAGDTQVDFDPGLSNNAQVQAAIAVGATLSVKLTDAVGNSVTTAGAVNIYVTGDYVAPGVPLNLVWSGGSLADWDDVATADNYHLEIRRDAAFPAGTVVTDTDTGSSLSQYNYPGAQPGVTYYFRVFTWDYALNFSAYSANSSGGLLTDNAPLAPTTPWVNDSQSGAQTDPGGTTIATDASTSALTSVVFSAVHNDDVGDAAVKARVKVSTTVLADPENDAALWDSGVIAIPSVTAGSRSADLLYRGPVLLTSATYHARIQFTEDNNGTEVKGAWSADLSFTLTYGVAPTVDTTTLAGQGRSVDPNATVIRFTNATTFTFKVVFDTDGATPIDLYYWYKENTATHTVALSGGGSTPDTTPTIVADESGTTGWLRGKLTVTPIQTKGILELQITTAGAGTVWFDDLRTSQ